MRRLFLPAGALLLLAGCGALQGPPAFQQTYGIVDTPCEASQAVSQCTAHVLLINNGRDGFGHATIVVPMKAAGGATAPASGARTGISNARCGTLIPDTASGAYADLTCSFDMPPGMMIAAAPRLVAVDYQFASNTTGTGDQTSGIATAILAAAAGLIALVTLIVVVGGRRPRTAGSPVRPDSEPSRPGEDLGDTW